jgi:hypothetical protein
MGVNPEPSRAATMAATTASWWAGRWWLSLAAPALAGRCLGLLPLACTSGRIFAWPCGQHGSIVWQHSFFNFHVTPPGPVGAVKVPGQCTVPQGLHAVSGLQAWLLLSPLPGRPFLLLFTSHWQCHYFMKLPRDSAWPHSLLLISKVSRFPRDMCRLFICISHFTLSSLKTENKNISCTTKFDFQINNKYFLSAHGPSLKIWTQDGHIWTVEMERTCTEHSSSFMCSSTVTTPPVFYVAI